jgi:ketosteroid isomerase-like protein
MDEKGRTSEGQGKRVASRLLAAWSSGDLQTVRALVHEDVRFAGPLGSAEGIETTCRACRPSRTVL